MHRVFPIFLALCLIFSLSACQKQIRPKRDKYYPTQKDYVDISPYKSPQLRSRQHAKLAVGVSISGGGSRAYGFAAGVLLGLEEVTNDLGGNFLSEIDYISATSGGGFAAGSFISAYHAHLLSNSQEAFLLGNYYDNFIKPNLLASYALPVIFGRLNPRTLFHHLDNGDHLERKIDNLICGRKLRARMGLPLDPIRLGDIFIPKENELKKVLFPLFVSNASLVSNIRLFTFAPQTLADYKVAGYTHRLKNYHYAAPMNPYELPLSVGIKASGTFPGAVGNSTLPSTYNGENYLHLFDGGLCDNVGFRAAIDMLKEDKVADTRILLVIDVDMNAYPNTFSKSPNGSFSIPSVLKTPLSGLVSRRMMRNKEIQEKCKVFGITPIFLDFTALIEGSTVAPPARIYVKKERERIIQMIKNEEKLSDLDLQILYELAEGIPTKYTMSARELEFLVTIGKAVVRQKSELLLSYLKEK
ncbi:MAG: patatin-like phospholipase family protein [Bacteroidota bacterium]